MNEHDHHSQGSDESVDRPDPLTQQPTPSAGTAIPLPAAAGTSLPPTGPNPPVGPGAPTPPAGMWTPPPSGWTPGGPVGAVAGGDWGGPPPPPGGGWTHYGFPPPPPAPTKRTGAVVGLASVVVVAAVLAGAGLGHAVWTSGTATPTASAPSSNPSGSSGGELPPTGNGSSGSGGFSPFGGSSNGNSSTGAGSPSNITAIAAKVSPALVDINTNLSYQNEQAAGTGMVLTSNGVILTNNHVIDGATSISVTDVGNAKTYDANVVGYDRTGDIAVIKLVGASGLQTVTTSQGTAAVGQAVVGVGNAGGTGGTPSSAGGSITAVDQSITASDNSGGNSENLTGLIETNAGIEPGDSGGSLVNASGQVIGMDTAASSSSQYQVSASQAYAIPIDTALTVAKQIQTGKASSTVHIGGTGFLGVSVQAPADSSQGGFGAGAFGGGGTGGATAPTSGAAVQSTLPGSAAAQAGLVAGDVITSLDGTSIGSATDLTNALEKHHPGDTVQLTWTDASGQSQTAGVKLASGPPA
jgi:S1-C subfamily serine protease